MDLKIKDVAELMHVSESTIRRWLSEGKIPAYRINQQYRFNRSEIEDWVMSHKIPQESIADIKPTCLSIENETAYESRQIQGSRQFSLYRAIHKGGVLINVEGNSKEEIIRNTMKALSPALKCDPDVLAELFIDRESLMPTALNHKIAVPHAREFTLPGHHDIVYVVFPRQPISWGALDDQPVEVLFFLFACNDKRHLNLLAKIAHASNDSSTRSFLLTKPSQAEILEKIKLLETRLNR